MSSRLNLIINFHLLFIYFLQTTSHNETSVSEVSSASSDFSAFSASDFNRKRLQVLLHNVTEWQREIRPLLIEMLEFQHESQQRTEHALKAILSEIRLSRSIAQSDRPHDS